MRKYIKETNTEGLASFSIGSENSCSDPHQSPCEHSALQKSWWPLIQRVGNPGLQHRGTETKDRRTASFLPASSQGQRAQPPSDTVTGSSPACSGGEKHLKESATNELIHSSSTCHVNDVSKGIQSTIPSRGTHRRGCTSSPPCRSGTPRAWPRARRAQLRRPTW